MLCNKVQMIKKPLLLACAAAFAALPLSAQETKPEQPSPPEIVSRAKAEEWVAIAPSDLLVLELAGIADGKVLKQRRVVIQLIPPPFSQGWVGNIHKLAAAKWWDGTSINRVQDNYVVQWGDATEKKALPEGLAVVPESGYKTALERIFPVDAGPVAGNKDGLPKSAIAEMDRAAMAPKMRDPYSETLFHFAGWPLAGDFESYWPTHCYGMVGVGRNLSPDTGSGAELYTVIGHAPRHLDRNIALVGRVIEGIEHLSSLPRGTGALGFYENEAERTPIVSVRIGDQVTGLPAYEYLSTESQTFAAYADARANRRDAFFNVPAGGADICNIPVPVRRRTQ
jgi:cyclophilin family peptidyl-prolyl cis-trans isomerase